MSLDAASLTFLNAHNQARAEVGAPLLQWDAALAASAQAYAIKLTAAGQLVHSPRDSRPKNVRENLLQSLPGDRSPAQMIGVWTAEKLNFTPGIFPNVSKTGDWYHVGHYCQMIWPTTTHVGCAIYGDSRFQWTVCHYSPPGNRDGVAVGIPPRSGPQPSEPPPPPPP